MICDKKKKNSLYCCIYYLLHISESPTKKSKVEKSEDFSNDNPRISSRLKKKSTKSSLSHFLDELDESEWMQEQEGLDDTGINKF